MKHQGLMGIGSNFPTLSWILPQFAELAQHTTPRSNHHPAAFFKQEFVGPATPCLEGLGKRTELLRGENRHAPCAFISQLSVAKSPPSKS